LGSWRACSGQGATSASCGSTPTPTSTPRPRRPRAISAACRWRSRRASGRSRFPPLGLRAIPTERLVLVDARDTDPGERTLLDRASVVRTRLTALDPARLPSAELYLHLDADVCDPEQLPGLLYAAPGGPTPSAVLSAVERVLATGRVAAIGFAATWRHDGGTFVAQRELARGLARAVERAPAPRRAAGCEP
jgi:arginase